MRVLVVEDEVRLADGIRAGLEAEGFAVDVAYDGTDGLWMAQEFASDAIVLDLMLPGRNGFQVCRELRASGVWTPILVLTAKDGEYDEIEALDTGADDFLSKPFSHAVLVARLRSLIRRGAPERPVVLEAGTVRLDTRARRVWQGDEEVVLTAKELAILERLLRSHGEVVSKREILDAVWDTAFEGATNIVEVYVKRLREKLGRDVIETLRGAGYRVA